MSDISPNEMEMYEVIAAETAELHASISGQPAADGESPQVCFTTRGEQAPDLLSESVP